MTNNWILSFFLCGAIVSNCLSLYGQVPQSMTLEDCIEYAVANSISTKNASLGIDIARARVREITGIGLPQVSGSVQVIHNSKLKRFFTTYDPNSSFNFLGDLSSLQGIQAEDVVAAQNFFQLKSAGEASLSVSQIIFNGSYLVGLKASKGYKVLASQTYDQERQKVIFDLTKAFYNVLINQERAMLFEANLARLDTLLKNTRALYENGFAEKIDVDRIQIQVNNMNTQYEKYKSLLEIVNLALKVQMNYPMDQPLTLKGNLQDVMLDDVSAESDAVQYEDRPDYRVMMANYDMQKLNMKNKIVQGIPSLSVYANIGYNTQSPNIGGVFKTNANFSDNGSIGPDKWYNFSMIGATLNIPIFSGLQRTYQVQQEKIRLLQMKNGLDALKNGIQLEVASANTDYQFALKSVNIQKANMELAQEVARISKIKYEQGVGSNLEVVQAETGLREAQVNYYNALFEAIVAKVNREKAYGLLK